MRKILLAAVSLAAMVASADARTDQLPKVFWGRWCAENPVTGGGEPGFWAYSHRECKNPAGKYRDREMTIGPNMVMGCRITKIAVINEIYRVATRCDKFEIWLEEGFIGFRNPEHPPYLAHPPEPEPEPPANQFPRWLGIEEPEEPPPVLASPGTFRG